MDEIEEEYYYFCRDYNNVIDNYIFNNYNYLIEENDNKLCRRRISYEYGEFLLVNEIIKVVKEKMDIVL